MTYFSLFSYHSV